MPYVPPSPYIQQSVKIKERKKLLLIRCARCGREGEEEGKWEEKRASGGRRGEETRGRKFTARWNVHQSVGIIFLFSFLR